MTITRGGTIYVEVTIEGLGTGSSILRFCSRVPAAQSGSAAYLPLLRSWPTELSEVASIVGGISEAGEINIGLVDGIDGRSVVTELFRWLRLAVDTLDAAIDEVETTLTFTDGADRAAGDIIYLGGEALRLVSFSAGSWTVARAAFGTDAAPHDAEDPVFLSSPYILGRRLRLYLGTHEDYPTLEEVGGGWAIDGLKFVDALNTWAIRGRSQLKFLDRIVHRKPGFGSIWIVDPAMQFMNFNLASGTGVIFTHFGGAYFYKVGDSDAEIVRLASFNITPIAERGVAGTRPREWTEGDPVRQVFAHHPELGCFGFQAPGDEDGALISLAHGRSYWTMSAHAVVLILNLVTSWSDPRARDLTNYTAGKGNFCILPPGVGVGYPAANIDFDSFYDVWNRTESYVLENFVIDSSETARTIIDRILKLTGYCLTTINGKLTLTLPRLPLEDEVTASWGPSEILGEEDEAGNLVPRVDVSIDTDSTAGAIVFKCRSSSGADVEIVYSDVDFPEIFGNAGGLYELDEKRLEIDARYIRVDDSGAEPEFFRARALKLLYLLHKPLQRIETVTDLEQRSVQQGELVSLTHAQIRDLEAGTVGVTDLVCRVLEKRLRIERGEIDWALASMPGGRRGRLCPSARIVSAASNTATVSANRYTDADGRWGGPTSDAAAFLAGDRVVLRNRDGTTIATTPAYQTVSSVGSNALTLDGNFGGNAAFSTAGTVIEFVGRDDQASQQYTRFVSFADRATRTVGASDQTAWQVGEA